MAARLTFWENIPEVVDRQLQGEMTSAVDALRKELRPTLPQLHVSDGSATFRNLVGSMRLPGGTVVEVQPKVRGNSDWTSAVVQLLEPETRISITGSRRSLTSARGSDLTAALALEYARRLESALRLEGPIQVYQRHTFSSRRLVGHLDVSRWVRQSILDPTLFPVGRDELSKSNDFTKGLSLVAGQLSRSAVGGELSSRLRRLQSAIIPGSPIPTYVDPAVARKALPAQWAKYRPAWDLAAALLRNRSLVGDPGRSSGLEIAIEPWPMLETLLTRSLRLLAHDNRLRLIPKTGHRLLTDMHDKSAANVFPDGALEQNGRVTATFECKYTLLGSGPAEKHIYQALSTAAALDSPLSVLVYPGDESAKTYQVTGFNGTPTTLVTVGLSLYSYTRGEGDIKRARILGDILATNSASQPPRRSAAIP